MRLVWLDFQKLPLLEVVYDDDSLCMNHFGRSLSPSGLRDCMQAHMMAVLTSTDDHITGGALLYEESASLTRISTVYRRTIEVTHALSGIRQLSWATDEKSGMTHNIPTAKTPMTIHFCLLGSRKSFSTYSGKMTTAMSVATLKEELKYQKISRSMHLPGRLSTQKASIGRQEHKEAIRIAIPYTQTIEIRIHAAIRVPGVMKNRRNWNSADNFVMVRVKL